MLANRGDGEVGVAAVILEIGDELAVRVEGERKGLRLHGRRQEAQCAHHHLAGGGVGREPVRDGRARSIDRNPEAVLAIEGDVVGEARQIVREDVRSSGLFAFQPIAQIR